MLTITHQYKSADSLIAEDVAQFAGSLQPPKKQDLKPFHGMDSSAEQLTGCQSLVLLGIQAFWLL